jgi:hypothetical protein
VDTASEEQWKIFAGAFLRKEEEDVDFGSQLQHFRKGCDRWTSSPSPQATE